MAWVMLAVTFTVCVLSALLSYRREWCDRWWFAPAFAAFSVVNGLAWGWAVKWAKSDRETYVLSLAWDVVVVGTWILVPILTGHVKLNGLLLGGVILMLAGMMVAKAGS